MVLSEEQAENLNLDGLSIMLESENEDPSSEKQLKENEELLKIIYENGKGTKNDKEKDKVNKVSINPQDISERVGILKRDEPQYEKKTFNDLAAWSKK